MAYRFPLPSVPMPAGKAINADVPSEVVYIAITVEDGTLTIMQFVTYQPARYEGEEGWSREPTDEAIEAEIEKSRFKAVKWRRIELSDLPPDRSQRNLWKDEGSGKIVIDESLGQ